MSVRATATLVSYRRLTNLPASSTAFTACGWAVRRVDTNAEGKIFGVYDSGGSQWHILEVDEAGDALRIRSTTGVTNFGVSLTNDVWFFAAIVCQGTGVNDFIGYYWPVTSNILTSVSMTGISFVPGQLILLSDNNLLFFNGGLGMFKVWSAALTQAELEMERWSCTPVRYADLNSWYPFWKVADAGDYSGFGRDMTQNGTPVNDDSPPVPWSFTRSPFLNLPTAIVTPIPFVPVTTIYVQQY